MQDRAAEIIGLGANLVAIGNGSVAFAQAFLEELEQGGDPAPFALFTDPGRASYRAFEMKRSPKDLFRLGLLGSALRAKRGGFEQAGVRGDALQNGGVVVVGTDGEAALVHIEEHAGDLADMDAVIEAVASLRSGRHP